MKLLTPSQPLFAKRLIQALNIMKHTMLEGLELDADKWVDIIQPIF